MTVPLFTFEMDKEEREATIRALSSSHLSRGPEIAMFEEEFATFCNKQHAVATSNGTSALHIAVRAMGWGETDEVITTPFSYIASSNCLLYEKATPVFADIDPLTLTLNPKLCEKKITSRTKGIILVHILGQAAERNAFKTLSEKYNLPIIEDACQALAPTSEEYPIGSIGKATVYSFFENKPITTGGEGGMIVTDDREFAAKCRSIRDQGRATGDNWLAEVSLGYNYRMTEMQAAIGRAQLKKIPVILEKRQTNAKQYKELLADNTEIRLPHNYQASWFCFPLRFETSHLTQSVHLALTAKGIESKIGYFPPIYRFPMYANKNVDRTDYPITEQTFSTLLTLPIHQKMNSHTIQFICDTILATIEKHRTNNHATPQLSRVL